MEIRSFIIHVNLGGVLKIFPGYDVDIVHAHLEI